MTDLMRWRLPAVLAALLLVPACGVASAKDASPSGTAAAHLHRCHGRIVFHGDSSDLATDLRERGVDCKTARVVAESSAGYPKRYRANGFRCVRGHEQQPPGGGMASYLYRCRAGHALITFRRW